VIFSLAVNAPSFGATERISIERSHVIGASEQLPVPVSRSLRLTALCEDTEWYLGEDKEG
jgi:hypothetical protein